MSTDRTKEKSTRMSKKSFNVNKPELGDRTIERMERGASSNGTGQQRRICLASMGRSLEQLNESSKQAPEVFAEMLEIAREYLGHARALVEVAEAAVFRLELADEKSDTLAVMTAKLGKKAEVSHA